MMNEDTALKILLIEDSEITADILKDMLALQWKALPMVFHDGKEAAAYLEGFSRPEEKPPIPDLIILDLILPGFSGLEILKKIKDIEPLRDVPMIVYTGSDRFDHLTEVKKWKGVQLLRKSMDKSSLQETIQKMLDLGVLRKKD